MHASFLAVLLNTWTSHPVTVSASVRKIDIFFPEPQKSSVEPAAIPRPLIETPAIDVPLPVIDIELAQRDIPEEKQAVAVNELAGDPDYPLTAPDYPRASLELGEEGRVVLRLTIRADGTVSDVYIVNGSGFALLDEAARNQALHAWRFRPTAPGAKEARLRTYTISLRFELTER